MEVSGLKTTYRDRNFDWYRTHRHRTTHSKQGSKPARPHTRTNPEKVPHTRTNDPLRHARRAPREHQAAVSASDRFTHAPPTRGRITALTAATRRRRGLAARAVVVRNAMVRQGAGKEARLAARAAAWRRGVAARGGGAGFRMRPATDPLQGFPAEEEVGG